MISSNIFENENKIVKWAVPEAQYSLSQNIQNFYLIFKYKIWMHPPPPVEQFSICITHTLEEP